MLAAARRGEQCNKDPEAEAVRNERSPHAPIEHLPDRLDERFHVERLT
jgi:hypothetical protein